MPHFYVVHGGGRPRRRAAAAAHNKRPPRVDVVGLRYGDAACARAGGRSGAA
jgi:hypothetical protein